MSKSKKKNNKATFLDDAEKIIRQYAELNENIVVYRGIITNEEGNNEEVIIAGLSDDKKIDRPPYYIETIRVHLDRMAIIEFHTGTKDDSSQGFFFSAFFCVNSATFCGKFNLLD